MGSQEELNNLTDKDNSEANPILEAYNKERIEEYSLFWKLYKGYLWEDYEEDEDKPTPSKNKIYTIVNKSIAFLVGKPFTVNYVTEEVENILSPYINQILENSGGKDVLGFNTVQVGSVTGDCFIKIVFDERVPLGVRLEVQDSRDITIIEEGVNNIPNEVLVSYEYYEGNKKHSYSERWTKDKVEIFTDNKKDEKASGDNLLGEVPFVHIKNLPSGNDIYGISDIKQIKDLNYLLNHQIRRFSDDVDYHGDPITLLFGARISDMEKGVNKLWGNLPLKARVENLILDTDFPAQQKFISYMDEAIHEVSSIPIDSVTGNKNISNTTGVALHMNLMPLIELTDRKAIFYSRGLAEAIRLSLLLTEAVERKYSSTDLIEDDVYVNTGELVSAISKITLNPEIKFKHKDETLKSLFLVEFADYLPKDKMLQLQMIAERIQLGLLSRKRALRELGEDNIEELLKEVDEEVAKKILESVTEIYGETSADVSEGMSKGTKIKEENEL